MIFRCSLICIVFVFLRKPQYRSARPDDIRIQCTQRSQFVGRIVFNVFNVFGVSSVFNASNFIDASHVFHCVQLQTGDSRVPKTCVLCIPLCSLYSTVLHCVPLYSTVFSSSARASAQNIAPQVSEATRHVSLRLSKNGALCGVQISSPQ